MKRGERGVFFQGHCVANIVKGGKLFSLYILPKDECESDRKCREKKFVKGGPNVVGKKLYSIFWGEKFLGCLNSRTFQVFGIGISISVLCIIPRFQGSRAK